MSQAGLIYKDAPDVTSRLAELGLEEAILVQAVQRGFAAWASCTANHPTVIPGIWGWGEAVRALREQLVLRGWERSNESNLPYIVNPSRTIAISVATGDDSTGRPDGVPSTASAKGPVTAGAVAINQIQWYLPGMEPTPAPPPIAGSRTTWMLLMHRDHGAAQEVRCELSRPININADGHIDGWAERIIMTPTSFDDDASLPESRGGTGPQSPEIILDIKRRA